MEGGSAKSEQNDTVRKCQCKKSFFLLKLTLPQASWLSIFFVGISVVLHLLEGLELRMHYWEDREEKKAHHPAGFESTTSLLRGMCSTAVLQPLPHCQKS